MSIQSQKARDLLQTRHLTGKWLLDKGDGAVQKVCLRSEACRSSTRFVDNCCGCVDSLGAAVFSSYLFKTVTSGEIGLSAGAEGATAPETLRQTDRVTC